MTKVFIPQKITVKEKLVIDVTFIGILIRETLKEPKQNAAALSLSASLSLSGETNR